MAERFYSEFAVTIVDLSSHECRCLQWCWRFDIRCVDVGNHLLPQTGNKLQSRVLERGEITRSWLFWFSVQDEIALYRVIWDANGCYRVCSFHRFWKSHWSHSGIHGRDASSLFQNRHLYELICVSRLSRRLGCLSQTTDTTDPEAKFQVGSWLR